MKYSKFWSHCLNFRKLTAIFWRPKIKELYSSENMYLLICFRLDVGTSQIRVGLAQMSSHQLTLPPPLTYPLNLNDQDMTPANVKNKISNLALIDAPRDTASALTAVTFSLFGLQGRPETPKVIIVITHGQSLPVPDIKIAAVGVASQGIDTISVGVGPSISDAELQYIATDVDSVVPATFADLQSEALPITLAGMLCEGMLIVI